jgi:tRNA threonylcarbamoyladenosine biosynthesis protein TsaB
VRILAIDTATENCSAALWIDGAVSAREKRLERGHASQILFMVDELLKESGTGLRALDAIAFGRGPGAFTGLRLAASVAQGLAFGSDLPVVPVSDLRALAQRALDMQPRVAGVLACTDARMHEVYWASFIRNGEEQADPLGDEHVGPAHDVRLPDAWTVSRTPVCGAGAGFAAYPELHRIISVGAVLEELLPRAQEVGRLAVTEVQSGRVLPPEQAVPVYLRDEVTQKRPPGH